MHALQLNAHDFFQDKVCLITGASSGIGYEIAKHLAPVRGVRLILLGRDADALNELERHLEGVRHHIIIEDLATIHAVSAVREKIPSGMTPSILINNAGVGLYGSLWQQDEKALSEIMLLNMHNLVMLTRAFIPHMISLGSGGILNIASIASFLPCPGAAVYGASKAFLKSFTEALRSELKPFGIHTVCYHPAGTRTQWLKRASQGKVVHRMKEDDPVRIALFALKALTKNASNRIPGIKKTLMVRILSFLPKDFVADFMYKKTLSEVLKNPEFPPVLTHRA